MGKEKNVIGSVKWQSPSNIAIVKYWGKKGKQIPINPSISFTLSNAFTETEITFSLKQTSTDVSVNFIFEQSKNQLFENKIIKFLNDIKSDFEIFGKYHLQISSKNSFPHSAGIASSASSMSALVLCLLSVEYPDSKISDETFFRKASYYSRLASGSASRSLYPGFTLWGKTEHLNSSSDDYATTLNFIHPIFNDLQDSILIVDSKQKKVSSSEGHRLMENHPYKDARIKQANDHTHELIRALKEGDFKTFERICEIEALGLHSLMMSSKPSYVLMGENSIKIIDKIREFRLKTNLNLCFTLDAGPNIHLIYPKSNLKEITSFIEKELLVYCESNKWISDELGAGPKQLNKSFYE